MFGNFPIWGLYYIPCTETIKNINEVFYSDMQVLCALMYQEMLLYT